ncbi:hypothetical protein [Pseudoalteromonas aurantia]|jgi:hypothetical protein|uniref:hypothetical protein n=1 Tax=Pseudoalteromonas aurantia TaxID=43654 RepID=UPI001486956E|nr:hypothetical protein [Pseudoalteromonas aurantia]
MKQYLLSALALGVSLTCMVQAATVNQLTQWQVDTPPGEFIGAKISVEQGTWMNVM